MWEKSKGTTQCDKRTVTCNVETAQCEEKKVIEPPNVRKKTIICDVRTAQCEDGTIKCEKKVREPPNVRKELSHMILEPHNVRMESLSVRKK